MLTQEQIREVKRLLDTQGELPSEWRWTMFPPEKQEYELVYGGKKREEDILANTMAVPLQNVRSFNNGNGKPTPGQWYNRLIFGDNLQAMKSLLDEPEVAGKVKLVYIDPPFATKQDFQGSQDQKAYQDKIAGAQFVEFLRKRLVICKSLMANDAAIIVHLDDRRVHYIKIVLDELFGEGSFRNSIIWRRTNSHNKLNKQFGPIHDTLLFYGMGAFTFTPGKRPLMRKYIEDRFIYEDKRGRYQTNYLTGPGTRNGDSGKPWRGFDPTANGRHWAIPSELKKLCPIDFSSHSQKEILEALLDAELIVFPKKKGGQPMYKQYITGGTPYQDIWGYQANTQGTLHGTEESIDQDVKYLEDDAERVDYPTQKPEGLLARCISSLTQENDLVLDFFAGSGTTPAVAEKLNRRWIAIDCGKLSQYTIQKRMLNLREGIGNVGQPLRAKPFALQNAGLYDFDSLKDLPWEDWRFFALQLFECKDKPHKISGMQLDGEKSGAPVLVFDWKKNVNETISEDTISDIHSMIGKKVGSKFYIIAPMMAFDFFQDYVDCGSTRYYALRIPYTMIQELHSRDFKAVLQAREEGNVNDIQEAYGFSFVVAPEVKWEAKVEKESGSLFESAVLRTKQFVSKARIKGTEREGGLETLAMLMIDLNYDGRIFDLDRVLYGEELENAKWRVEFSPDEIGEKMMAVWIDYHGNESKAVISRQDFGLKPILTNSAQSKAKSAASARPTVVARTSAKAFRIPKAVVKRKAALPQKVNAKGKAKRK